MFIVVYCYHGGMVWHGMAWRGFILNVYVFVCIDGCWHSLLQTLFVVDMSLYCVNV